MTRLNLPSNDLLGLSRLVRNSRISMLALISCLLLIVTIWVLSYQYRFGYRMKRWELRAEYGVLGLTVGPSSHKSETPGFYGSRILFKWPDEFTRFQFPRVVSLSEGQRIPTADWWAAILPLWVVFSVVLLYLIIRLRMPRKLEPCCAKCGYCIIGNTNGICPECGSKISLEQLALIRATTRDLESGRCHGSFLNQ